MNKYVVAHLSLFDGDLKQEVVEAESTLEAALSYLGFEEDECSEYDSLDDLVEAQFNQDCFLGVLELSNSRTGRSGTGLQTHEAQFDSAESFH